MLTCANLSVRYVIGEIEMWPLRGVSLHVATGTTAIVGPSGSGKSTFLRVLAGLQHPTSGTVCIDGESVGTGSRRADGDPRVALVHQDYRLVSFLTVEENIALAAEMRGVALGRGSVASALSLVGLAGFEQRLPRTLSGGEQQRVAIARAMVARPAVLLADEPTGALDRANTGAVAQIFHELGERGVVVVVATHDPLVSCAMSRTLELRDGSLVDATAMQA